MGKAVPLPRLGRSPCGALFATLLVALGLNAGVGLSRPAPPPGGPASRHDLLGDTLPEGAVLRLGTTRLRHRGVVSAVAISHDGKLLATGNSHSASDSSVALWDTTTGRRVRLWAGHAHVVRSVAFSPDGKKLVTVGGDAAVHVWDLASGDELWRVPAESPEMATWSPDGKILLVTDRNLARRWASDTRKELPPLAGHTDRLFRVDVSSDGKTYATCAMDGTVRVWDERGKEKLLLKLPEKYALTVALAPDGKRLACGTFNGDILAWDLPAGKLAWRVASGDHRVWSLAFSPDGATLASAGVNLRTWDAATGAARKTIESGVIADVVAFAPDGKRLVCGGGDAVPRFWHLATGKEVLTFQGHRKPILSASFSPDGATLATTSGERGVWLWDCATGKLRGKRAEGPALVPWAAFSPDGKSLAVSSSGDILTLWDVDTNRCSWRFRDRGAGPVGGRVYFSADGQTLAVGTWNSRAVLWDVASGKRRPHAFEASDDLLRSSLWQSPCFVLAPDGKTLAAARGNLGHSAVVLWDAATGKERTVLAAQGLPAAFAPDGRTVVIITEGSVRLVDLEGKELATFKGETGDLRCAAFSPDGRTLATAGIGGVVDLWELASGQRRHSFTGHEDRIDVLAFSPDGRRLASGGEDRTVLLWDLAGGKTRSLSAKEKDALWGDLAGEDAARADRAIRTLSANGDQTVGLLRERLRPLEAADPQRVRKLLAALDSERFDERERATAELAELRYAAAPVLRQALTKELSLEARLRVRRLVEQLDRQSLTSAELQAVRAVEVLERAGSPAAREVLARIAKGAEGAPRTEQARAALRRLALRRER